MDYSTLPLGRGQIRLLTMDPIPPDEDIDSPIKMRMYVRRKPLPDTMPIYHSGQIPSNYISFDNYILEPPWEPFSAAIRRDIAKIEINNLIKKQSRKPSALFSRVAEKIAAKLHITAARATSSDILIPLDDIPNYLTREDFLSVTQDITAGYPDFSFSKYESGPKTYGKLPLAQLNPFFKVLTKPPGPGYPEPPPMPLPGAETSPPTISPASSSRPSRTDKKKNKKPHRTSSRKSPENYIALSYAWGLESDPHHTIYVNDRPVSVRQNLFSALREFRTTLAEYFNPTSSPGQKGAIWIDALCINQSCDAEKSSQVQLMSMIYNYAGNILVWLGDNSLTPASVAHIDVIAFLETWSTFHRVEIAEVFDGSDPLTATTWRTMAFLRLRTVGRQRREELFGDHVEGGHPFGHGEGRALWEFFNLPYWKRLWIIQELAMGRPGMPIMMGPRVTQWRYIRDAVLLFAPVFDKLWEAAREDFERAGLEKELEPEHPIAHVAKIAQLEISGHRQVLPRIDPGSLVIYAPAVMKEGPLRGSKLRQAVLLASRAECSKAHDRIYGLLSIPGLPRSFNLMEVDYEMPVGVVFRTFTVLCVESGSLDFLALVDGVPLSIPNEIEVKGQGSNRETPSWVPDYAAAPERRIGIIEGDWNAGGETGDEFPTFFSFMGGGGGCYPPRLIEVGKLQCCGSVVDEIAAVGAVSQLDMEAARAMFGQVDESCFGVKNVEVGSGDEVAGSEDGASQRSLPLAENILHKVLVGGCDLSGEKKTVGGFKVLYTAFTGMLLFSLFSFSHHSHISGFELTVDFLVASEPPKGSPSYRNWHFLNSSANLQVQGRPLSSYFTPTEDPVAQQLSSSSLNSTSTAAQAHLAMTARTKMRRLLITKSGMIGLGPITSQPGDKVISIIGYGKAIIACQKEVDPGPDGETDEERHWRKYRGPQHFRLRGEAYVEGMMKSERMPINTRKPELMMGSSMPDGQQIDPLVFV